MRRYAATVNDWQGATGWRCHRCGASVPNGCTHHCPTGVFPEGFAGRPYDQQPRTIISTPPPMQRGWECPKCGSVQAPWKSTCPNCGPKR